MGYIALAEVQDHLLFYSLLLWLFEEYFLKKKLAWITLQYKIGKKVQKMQRLVSSEWNGTDL